MRMALLGWVLATLLASVAAVSVVAPKDVYAKSNPGKGGGGGKKKEEPPKVENKFCWKDTYGRGAGTIPTGCSSGQNDAGLCYNNCNAGFKGIGPVCWKHCPAGFSDHGVGCTKPAPYGRGGGYPWKFGDGFNNDGMLGRCRAANPAGCEMDGAIAYPTCKPGFHKVGCCICSPNCPSDFGDTGATCTKPSYGRGVGTVPNGCPSGQIFDAGLCYANCRTGFSGVGPVCWGNCPAGMTSPCGAGCANTAAACTSQVTDQVLSVVEVVANIALAAGTGGGSAAAKAAGKTAAVAATKAASSAGGKITKAAARSAILKASRETGKAIAETQVEQAASAASGEDWDPYSLDPTGIAAIVKAYNHKKCSG